MVSRADSAFKRSSASTMAVAASSRAFVVAISRVARYSAAFSWRSSSKMAWVVSTSLALVFFSASRFSSLVTTRCVVVISVIFRMPSASRMLCGSSTASGVCSRYSMATSSSR